jgi:phosphoribosyl 1,2-cyclic phosphate phosphodiesterase
MKKGIVTLLGTGASTGVPMIGCKCKVCQSQNKKNKRMRPAILIKLNGKTILVDAGPDIRAQLLKHNIDQIDGLILTHAHNDHVAGLDELRVFFFKTKKALPCFLSKKTYLDIKKRFYYLFSKQTKNMNYTAKFDFQIIPKTNNSCFLDLAFNCLFYFQGGTEVTGFVLGDFAYLCDIRDYHPSIFKKLQKINTLIISALRHQPSHVHFSVEEAIDFAKKTSSKKTYFTHIAHELEHTKENKQLPKGFELGFDGRQIGFEYAI